MPFLFGLVRFWRLMTKKTYILDTNVLLSDSNSLFGFKEHDVVLPLIVLEELDRHKDRQDEVGRNARDFVRKLSELTKENQDFKQGISLGKNLGMLRILAISDLVKVFGDKAEVEQLPFELQDNKTGDNTIAQFCVNYVHTHKDETVVLITRDTILRLKAKALGVVVEDYKKFNVVTSVSALYSGVEVLEDVEGVDTNEFYACEDGYILPPAVEEKLHPNQFVILKTGQQSAVARFIEPGQPLKKMTKNPGKLTPRNKEQEFAKELLFDNNVKLITLAGAAGTGKTLLSIDAGLEQVLNGKRYRSLVICRPVMPVGRDIGFLPGDLNEKLEPWLAPIKDNLRFLLSDYGKKSKFDEQVLQSYFDEGIIEVQAMTFIRGRSIANAFIIIDEAQNTNLHEMKTILTRVGENTKIVLTGDIEQIDNTYVDSVSNGLSIAIERFKPQSIAGHVTFKKGERSKLATIAAEILR